MKDESHNIYVDEQDEDLAYDNYRQRLVDDGYRKRCPDCLAWVKHDGLCIECRIERDDASRTRKEMLVDFFIFVIVAAFLLAAFTIYSAAEAHGTRAIEPRMCVTESGHKRVPCPTTDGDRQ